ncbi:MAG TPA: bifunctional riboflavin kinase/FAD synthetase [Nitrolancea sp.]|nr:bifunctional riboflavin kinase/FAD synthetase [Nitrolancea sp.]
MIPQLFPDFDNRDSERHVLTIGNFDGVHRGHQHLLGLVVSAANANEAQSGALTFDPLPLEVLRPEVSPPRLTSTADRLQLIRACGIDSVIPISFTREIASLEAPQFVEQVVNALRPVEIVVGSDFAFGRDRSGNVDVLRLLGALFSYTVTVVDRIGDGTQDFSSSRVRAGLANGDVRSAAEILGRPYFLRGTVVVGQRRGRELGFPTANLAEMGKLSIPADGIYAAMTQTQSGSALIPSMVYVGTNPTFNEKARVVEVNLLGFDGDLYGTGLVVLFADRVRGDQRFENPAQLISQMHRDRERTIGLIGALSSDWPGQALREILKIGNGALTGDR